MTMEIDELTGIIINSSIKIHSKIGPGCFEKIYDEILYYELSKVKLVVERHVVLPIVYEELYLRNAYKIDMLVERKLVVELKTLFPLPAVCFEQLRSYLSLLDLKNGLLLNFKVPLMKEGIHRVFNNKGKSGLELRV